jgi:hypothetical protein
MPKFRYQFGFEIFSYILWFNVSAERFGKSLQNFLLHPGQIKNIEGSELIGFFTDPSFVLRDGWRLYRAVPITDDFDNFSLPPRSVH